ncbi:MAG: hypothetical protein ACOX4F_05765 [Atopobiaceae bacterium]
MAKQGIADGISRAIYSYICSSDGVKARDIASALKVSHTQVNRCLYNSPFISDLCFRDESYRWYGTIQQSVPHAGIEVFSGWYGMVGDLLAQPADSWLAELKQGCTRIGRNLNDQRGLIHSFEDTHDTMLELFKELLEFGVACRDWEVCFELRIRRGHRIRIYTDVLVITPGYAFSLEFKMKDAIEDLELSQAAKYAPYLEVVLGPDYEVIPALVLTRAQDLFIHQTLPRDSAEIAVCSGDMLFNVFDEYLSFLK